MVSCVCLSLSRPPIRGGRGLCQVRGLDFVSKLAEGSVYAVIALVFGEKFYCFWCN